jgi:hypothetical protein
LAARLERAVARDVDVAELEIIERDTPLLLRYALDEGRVLIDRGERWPMVLARRDEVIRAVRRAERAERRAVQESWRMVVEEA